MNFDDVVYVLILLLGIAFGKVYRKFKDVEQAKFIGTGVGLLLTFIVSGWHILHPLISGSVCALIILLVDKRYVNKKLIQSFCLRLTEMHVPKKKRTTANKHFVATNIISSGIRQTFMHFGGTISDKVNINYTVLIHSRMIISLILMNIFIVSFACAAKITLIVDITLSMLHAVSV